MEQVALEGYSSGLPLQMGKYCKMPLCKKILGCPPLSIGSEVAVLLKDWALSQDREKVEVMPRAERKVLHKTGKSLKKQDAHLVVGAMVWLFLTAVRKIIKKKDVLL